MGKNKLMAAVGGKRNRNVVSTTIDSLVENGLLDAQQQGQKLTYTLTTEGEEWLC